MALGIAALLTLILGALALYAMRSKTPVAELPMEKFTSTKPESFGLDYLFEKYGQLNSVDPLLLKAVATAESNLNPKAVRNNPPHDVSVGLMQILYLPSIPGDLSSPPSNRFNVNGWKDATFERLQDPDFNIMIAAQILSYNLRIYGYPRGVAVYNSYSARNDPAQGPFRNQTYVNRVLREYALLRGE